MNENPVKKNLTKSLWLRAIVYALYASTAWAFTLLAGANSIPESLDVLALVACAFFCVMGGVASFGLLAICRRKGLWGTSEYASALFGRTGIPCLVVLACFIEMDDLCFRVIAQRLLVGYFLTAPVHVWLTIPSESEFQAGYIATIDRRRVQHIVHDDEES